MIAQCRLGILHVRMETARYKCEKEEGHLNILLNKRELENENHFLTCCPMYNEERRIFDAKVRKEVIILLSYVAQFLCKNIIHEKWVGGDYVSLSYRKDSLFSHYTPDSCHWESGWLPTLDSQCFSNIHVHFTPAASYC